VLAALGWMLFPAVRWLYTRLDLRPTSLLIAIGMTILSLVMLVSAALIVQEDQRRYEEILWPLPEIVNPTMPDMNSIARGQSLFEQACPDWTGRTYESLQRNILVMRDDELYAALHEGWRGLPACNGNMSEAQWWDMVNYLRTYERSAVFERDS
jgi:hypothetical protein